MALPGKGIRPAPRRLARGFTAMMAEVGAPVELEERLAELERQHGEGSLTDIGYNLRRNLLITRADDLARRRTAAAVATVSRDEPHFRRAAPARTRPAPPGGRDTGAPVHAPGASAGRGWARLTSRGAVVLAALVVIGAVLLVAHQLSSAAPVASGQPAAQTQGGGGAPTAAAAALGQGTTPASAPGGAATLIGVTQASPGGGTVTLVGYADHFGSTSSINNPLPSGSFYAAVELRVCAGSAAAEVSPFQFALVEPDQVQVDIASGPTVGRQPALALAPLPPSDCASGWLSYGVTARPTSLVDSADGLTWQIPG